MDYVGQPINLPKTHYLSLFRLLKQKYLRQGGLTNKHLFLRVLEAEKSKIKVQADSVSGESRLPSS